MRNQAPEELLEPLRPTGVPAAVGTQRRALGTGQHGAPSGCARTTLVLRASCERPGNVVSVSVTSAQAASPPSHAPVEAGRPQHIVCELALRVEVNRRSSAPESAASVAIERTSSPTISTGGRTGPSCNDSSTRASRPQGRSKWATVVTFAPAGSRFDPPRSS
jgi:hypothetical protein